MVQKITERSNKISSGHRKKIAKLHFVEENQPPRDIVKNIAKLHLRRKLPWDTVKRPLNYFSFSENLHWRC